MGLVDWKRISSASPQAEDFWFGRAFLFCCLPLTWELSFGSELKSFDEKIYRIYEWNDILDSRAQNPSRPPNINFHLSAGCFIYLFF